MWLASGVFFVWSSVISGISSFQSNVVLTLSDLNLN